MDIAKLKLNQHMRKTAVKEAIQFKFKKQVIAYKAQMKKAIADYALSRKENKEVIKLYETLPDNLKKLVRLTSSVTLATVDKNGDESKNILSIDCSMLYLDLGNNSAYFPFAADSIERLGYRQTTELTFAKPLVDTHFVFTADKIPSTIKKAFEVRKQLIASIETFAHDSYHALTQVKSLKDVREYVPALEQFIPIPEKEFTKMVPYSFFKKVNDSINLK